MEMSPYVKVGGVADVIYNWAKTLSKRRHEVTVALPALLPNVPPPPAWLDLQVLHIKGFLAKNPYANEIDYHGHHTGAIHQFIQAIFTLCETRAAQGRAFDILHVNEWPVALIPFLLSRQQLGFPSPKSVLTIHGAIYQGIFPAWAFERFRVSPFGPPRIVDTEGLINPLVAGVLSCDVLTVPSRTYIKDLLDIKQKDFIGASLFEALQHHAHKIRGILHGVNREEWNPATDPALYQRYDINDLRGKSACKTNLETELGLGGEQGSPVILSAGRLCAAKGTDLLVELLPALYKLNVRIVIAGAGEPAYEKLVQDAVARAPCGLALYVGWVDSPTMRKLYSGADILLMPSRHEACGLTQMEAQRYGTVPVVHRCGGLADTVIGHTKGSHTSTGFFFEKPSIDDLKTVVEEALRLLPTPAFDELRKRCMDAPPDWETAAEQYEKAYRQSLLD
jgi:starch synthase